MKELTDRRNVAFDVVLILNVILSAAAREANVARQATINFVKRIAKNRVYVLRTSRQMVE